MLGDDRIVLSEGSVTRVTACGAVVWRTAAPADDPFVEVCVTDTQVFANSWSGQRVSLDPGTGAVLDRRLVK